MVYQRSKRIPKVCERLQQFDELSLPFLRASLLYSATLECCCENLNRIVAFLFSIMSNVCDPSWKNRVKYLSFLGSKS